MLKKILLMARILGASDVHISEGYPPMVRINGSLNNMYEQVEAKKKSFNFSVADCMDDYGNKANSYKLKRYIELLANEKQLRLLENEGEVDFAIEDNEKGRYRVNIYRAKEQYALAIRLLNKEIPSCSKLNIPLTVERFAFEKSGLVLVTGPTGSGKSTTLAALLQSLNSKAKLHIITLEDPIEYRFPQGKGIINQREVGNDTKSFASGLRSALREDPDIIMVGELRDAEALKVALQAAETGHLVFSTLHTRGAIATINRIINMLPEEKEQVRVQLSETLVGIVSQELHNCRDGRGRIVAMEILINNNAVSNLIREGRTHQLNSYLESGNKYGMQTMEAALEKLRSQNVI